MEKGLIITIAFWVIVGFYLLCAWVYLIASKNQMKEHEEEIYERRQHEFNNDN